MQRQGLGGGEAVAGRAQLAPHEGVAMAFAPQTPELLGDCLERHLNLPLDFEGPFTVRHLTHVAVLATAHSAGYAATAHLVSLLAAPHHHRPTRARTAPSGCRGSAGTVRTVPARRPGSTTTARAPLPRASKHRPRPATDPARWPATRRPEDSAGRASSVRPRRRERGHQQTQPHTPDGTEGAPRESGKRGGLPNALAPRWRRPPPARPPTPPSEPCAQQPRPGQSRDGAATKKCGREGRSPTRRKAP